MIPELGHFALILALICALFASIIPMVRRDGSLLTVQKRAVAWQFSLITLSMLILAVSFYTNDFSVAYVAQNSNSTLPAIYRIAAVWGAHEGSMLLWLWILSLWTAAVSFFNNPLDNKMRSHMLLVLTLVASGFALFILLTSNPFTRLLPISPSNGRDLNPLLQDPGLVMHPPVLYTGYVGFAIPFAFACAALIRGKLEQNWVRWLQPWVLFAWSALTIGITMGSWWAYRELGWGGWWFWDPVENASLLPWLLGTALVHSLMVTAKRGAFSAWTILLAIGCFALSLIGTFLVRSGVLVSVHAFANDSARGAYILGFLVLVLGASLTLFALRADKLPGKTALNIWSREAFILINNALLTVAMLTVLLGTVYPLVIDALGLGKLSVGPPYFNAVMIPIMLPLMLLMAVVPLINWYRTERKLLKKWGLVGLVALAAGLFAPWYLTGQISLSVIAGVTVALSVILLLGFSRRTNWSMLLAHLGVAVCVLGITLSSAFSDHREVSMKVGEDVSVGPYHFTLKNVSETRGANYKALRASVDVSDAKKYLTTLYPEQRLFTVQDTALAKTAIDVGLFRDLYIALGQPLDDNAWAMRLYYKPFVRWIWAGGFLMLLGGLIGVLKRTRATA